MQMLHSLAKSKQHLSRVLDQEPIWALSSLSRQGKNLEEKRMVIIQAKELQFFAQPFPKQVVNKECKYKSNFCSAVPFLFYCWKTAAQKVSFQGTPGDCSLISCIRTEHVPQVLAPNITCFMKAFSFSGLRK